MNLPKFRFVILSRPAAGVIVVRWSIEPIAAAVLQDYVFEIFRSNSPTGPWDLLGIAPVGRFEYTDNHTIGDPVSRTYYYIVRAASTTGKGYSDSTPILLEHDADNIAIELVRKKNLYLTVKGGIAVAVFIKKTWGAKCNRCWNPERLSADDPDCPECYGTGYPGGFMNPVFVPALFNPAKKTVVESGIKYEPTNIYIELGNHPVIDENDMIVDRKQNIRYSVEQVTVTARRMHTISQIAVLNRIDENSVKYIIPVPEPINAAAARSWDQIKRQ